MEDVVRSLRGDGGGGGGQTAGDAGDSDGDEPFHESAPYGLVVHDESTGRWQLQVRQAGDDDEDEPKVELNFATQEAAVAAFDGVLAAINNANTEDELAVAGAHHDEEIDSDDAGWDDEDEAKYGLAKGSGSSSSNRSNNNHFALLLLIVLAAFLLGTRSAGTPGSMAAAIEAGMKTMPNDPPV